MATLKTKKSIESLRSHKQTLVPSPDTTASGVGGAGGLGSTDITSTPQTMDEQAPLLRKVEMYKKPEFSPANAQSNLSKQELLKLLEEA
jgi:hypothetical protein